MKSKIEYACFICGKDIEDEGGVNPCQVDLVSNKDSSSENPDSQRFYCHISCFKKTNKYAAVYNSSFDNAKK